MQSSIEITNKLKTNWEQIKKSIRIESGITDISYNTWIDPLTVYSVKDNTVINEFSLSGSFIWNQNYLDEQIKNNFFF